MEFDKLKEVIASVLCVDTKEITLNTTFVDDLGADSLDVYQIVMGIEQEFDITIREEDVAQLTMVSEVLELIRNSVN